MSDLNSTGNEARTDLEIFSWGYDERLSWLGAAWECADNGHYYELPVNQEDLIGLLRAGVHHSSALHCKLNVLTSTFEPTALLSSKSLRLAKKPAPRGAKKGWNKAARRRWKAARRH